MSDKIKPVELTEKERKIVSGLCTAVQAQLLAGAFQGRMDIETLLDLSEAIENLNMIKVKMRQ
jgi:hypothetical protein